MKKCPGKGAFPGLIVCGFVLFSLTRSGAQLPAVVPPPFVVAQSDYGGQNGNPGGTTIGYPWGQTFTATTGGTLYSISAGFYAPQSGLPPYYIYQFRDVTSDGLPSTQVTASVNVPTALLTTSPPPYGYGWIDLTADFSSFGIPLLTGHQYAFSIDLPGIAGTTIYNSFFWGMTGSGYGGGTPFFLYDSSGTTQAYLLDSSEDFLFTVRAVPEPSLALLAVLGGIGLFRCRRS